MSETRIAVVGLVVVLYCAWIGVVAGQSGPNIPWRVFSGGGAPASAGTVVLNGSLGQTHIGVFAAPGAGPAAVGAGFWYGVRAWLGGFPGLHRAFLPFIQQRFLDGPDLVVDDLRAAANGVTVRIRNAGTQPVQDDFWVDVYFNPRVSPPRINQPWPNIASVGVVWGVLAAANPIPPGGTLDLSSDTGDPYYSSKYSAAGPYPVGAEVWAYADSVNFETSHGAVKETDEDNNTRRFSPSLAALDGRKAAPARLSRPSGPAHLAPRRP